MLHVKNGVVIWVCMIQAIEETWMETASLEPFILQDFLFYPEGLRFFEVS